MQTNLVETGVPCFSHSNPRVYIASPGFNQEQLDTIREVEQILHECGYDTYSPFRDGITLAPDAPKSHLIQVARSNQHAIWQSDLMVAIVDDKDTGTTWEFGGANMLHKPVISLSGRTKRRNVMLSQTVLAHVENYEELRDVLAIYRPFVEYGRKVTLDLIHSEETTRAHLSRTYTFKGETQ